MHDRARANDRVVSDRYTRENRRVRSHHHMGPDMNIAKPIFLGQIFMSQYRRVVPDNRIIADMDLLRKKHIHHHH